MLSTPGPALVLSVRGEVEAETDSERGGGRNVWWVTYFDMHAFAQCRPFSWALLLTLAAVKNLIRFDARIGANFSYTIISGVVSTLHWFFWTACCQFNLQEKHFNDLFLSLFFLPQNQTTSQCSWPFFLARKAKSNQAVWIDMMPVICSIVWDQTERRLWPGCDIMQGVEPSGGLSPNEM